MYSTVSCCQSRGRGGTVSATINFGAAAVLADDVASIPIGVPSVGLMAAH